MATMPEPKFPDAQLRIFALDKAVEVSKSFEFPEGADIGGTVVGRAETFYAFLTTKPTDDQGNELKTETTLQDGPHSRACGIRKHDHGPDCHPNCPTCGGRKLTHASAT